ncbi:MAG: class B sortase [Mogibacterium sp.]|nr:class B sortase [Mogibacterium sp.]
MSEKQQKWRNLNKEFRKWRRINTWIDRVILSVLLALIVFTGSGLIDGFVFLEEGVKGVEYHSFSRLRRINPDVEAWITVDGTHIDHPVVRSADNFDYLDKGFDGKFYAGGTLFMDMNDESFEDPYCMIHGHHMAAGAMFGDLDRFLDGDFFERNSSGVLLTPEYDYDIEVFAAGVYNAYDRNIYRAGRTFMYEYVKENAVNIRERGLHDHVLALSTCMDDMTDNRAVVFCDLVNRRKHR